MSLMIKTSHSLRSEPILEIRNLRVSFYTYAGVVKAIDGVDLTLFSGETVGLVGESGCGKSVTAMAIVGLLPENAKVESGQIIFKGEDLLKKDKEELRLIRSKHIAMIFQDPMTYLNPVMTIGEQLEEVFELDQQRIAQEALKLRIDELQRQLSNGSHNGNGIQAEVSELKEKLSAPPKPSRSLAKKVVRQMVVDVLSKVMLPEPERIMRSYPHELSGGMRQRAMIAMAIARKPDLLIADEITTALDVTIQAQILELLRILRREINSTIVIITHDLGVAASICDRIAVMYAGNVVEVADIRELFMKPLHPYTQGLLKAVPRMTEHDVRLESIPGSVPDLINPPSGCRFHPRCPYAWQKCKEIKPKLLEAEPNHLVHCHLYDKGEGYPASGDQ